MGSRPSGAGAGSEQRLAVGGRVARASAWWPGGRGGPEGGPDGVGDKLPGLRVDGDVAAEQHPADDLPGVPGRILPGRRPLSALLVEVVVHGGAVHADGLGDLSDGVLPLSVRPVAWYMRRTAAAQASPPSGPGPTRRPAPPSTGRA